MNHKAVVFPGQGAQCVGMGRDVAEASTRARRVFERANDILGFDLAAICFSGPASELERTDIQQPAIFVTSVAIFEAFVEAGGERKWFSWSGGLSLGEYTALHVAEAVSFEQALRLVYRRGQLMQQAATSEPSGMVCLVGADEDMAKAMCLRAAGDDLLVPANFNCPDQVVVSGHRDACDRALAVASEFGCRAVALAVAGAFHSPLMEPAAAGLWPVLQETAFRQPVIPVIANVDGEAHNDPTAIRASLHRQLTHPVRWQRCIERMIADGAREFVEIGPGRVLSGLVRKISRDVSAVSINNAASLEAAMEKAGVV